MDSSRPIRPNRSTPRQALLDQDGASCFWCGRPLTGLVEPTIDHLIPRAKGGPSWPANEVASCRRCNGERGHRAPVAWLEECSRRGWPTRPQQLRAKLVELRAAIALSGGQRRARPYLLGQLRRLQLRPE